MRRHRDRVDVDGIVKRARNAPIRVRLVKSNPWVGWILCEQLSPSLSRRTSLHDPQAASQLTKKPRLCLVRLRQLVQPLNGRARDLGIRALQSLTVASDIVDTLGRVVVAVLDLSVGVEVAVLGRPALWLVVVRRRVGVVQLSQTCSKI